MSEWLQDGAQKPTSMLTLPPNELRSMPDVMKRVQAVKSMRLSNAKTSTVERTSSPAHFGELRQPASKYLLIPSVSSKLRSYVPIGLMDASVVVSNLVYAVPDAMLFHFGVMTSSMHNAFMRFTCWRLKSDFRYFNTIVYNNYPWPGLAGEALSDKHRNAMEQAAQCVFDARAQFASSSLADLYDPLSMPLALLKAHQKLDAAVDAAYQPSGGKKTYVSDAEHVAFLFELYQRITSLLPTGKTTKRKLK